MKLFDRSRDEFSKRNVLLRLKSFQIIIIFRTRRENEDLILNYI